MAVQKVSAASGKVSVTIRASDRSSIEISLVASGEIGSSLASLGRVRARRRKGTPRRTRSMRSEARDAREELSRESERSRDIYIYIYIEDGFHS